MGRSLWLACAVIAAAVTVSFGSTARSALAAAARSSGSCTVIRDRSTSSSTATWIRFVNETTGEVAVGELERGTTHYVRTLMPGEGYVQHTYLTHPFEIFDRSDQCIGYVLPTKRPRVYRITGPGETSVSVALLGPNQQELGTVSFWAPVDARNPGARVVI